MNTEDPEIKRLLDELVDLREAAKSIVTLRATANHLASEGWVKLKWRPGTERPPHNGIMVCVSKKGNIWSCENPYYVTEECRWLYAAELLGDKAKEGEE